MKAIILAAGKGTRMFPLGTTTPKLLMPLFNRPLIHHFEKILEGFVDEVILVIDKEDFGHKIKNYIKSTKWPFKISFAEQDKQRGTAHALQCAKDFIQKNEKFLFMYGDDLYSRDDIENALRYENSIVGQPVTDPEKWGILQADNEGNLVHIVEKPQEYIGNLANIGVMLLDSEIFDLFYEIKESVRGEFELTDSLTLFAKSKKVKVLQLVGYWIPVGYPWHILQAHQILIRDVRFNIEGEIESNVTIRGQLKLGKGSVIKAGSYIEGDVVIGENCTIGPNAYIRGISVIGDNTKVGFAVELKNTTVFSGTKIPYLSYFGDSIIGFNVNCNAGSKSGNWDPDQQSIKTKIKGNDVNTGLKKFGVVLGDNVRLGIDSIVMPGVKIAPNTVVQAGSVIKDDIES